MNERIRQLADEAAKYSAIMALPTGESGDKLFVKKFAELIVRQCVLEIKMTMVRDGYDTKHYLQSLKHIDHICKHFGVEE